jgi:hypothetical protein
MNDMVANNLALVQSDPAFKSAFLLAVGSRTGKRANSVGRESWSICNRNSPPTISAGSTQAMNGEVNGKTSRKLFYCAGSQTPRRSDRRFCCACDFAALLNISVGRGSSYQGTRTDHCGSLSPIHRWRDSRGQRKAKMVGPFRAAIPICSCGRRFFGACYSGAVDCL